MNTSTKRTPEPIDYPANVLDLLLQENIISDLENAIGQCRTIGMALHGLADSGASEKDILSASGAAAMTADFLNATLYKITNLVEGVKLSKK